MAHPFAPRSSRSVSASPSTESSLTDSSVSSYTRIPSPIKFIPASKPTTPLRIAIPPVNLTPQEKAMLTFIDLCTPANSPVSDTLSDSEVIELASAPTAPTTEALPTSISGSSWIRNALSGPPAFDTLMDSPKGGLQTRPATPETPTKPGPPRRGIRSSYGLPVSDERYKQLCSTSLPIGNPSESQANSPTIHASQAPLPSNSPKIDYEQLAKKNIETKRGPDGSYGDWVLPTMVKGAKRTTLKHAMPIQRPIMVMNKRPRAPGPRHRETWDTDFEGHQKDITPWNDNDPRSMLDLPFKKISAPLKDKTSSFWVVTRGALMGVFDKEEDVLKSTRGFSFAVIKGFPDQLNALLVWDTAWKDHLIGRNAAPNKFPDPMQSFDDEQSGKIGLFDKGKVPDKQKLYWVVIASLAPKIYTTYETTLNAAGKINYSLVKIAFSERRALDALHDAVGRKQVEYVTSKPRPSIPNTA
ncbi:uncharacterized protein EV420DRAFT_1477413 [Desarmillaria tabescens]|uniref:Uncharacterized protein n=1 Tax=Armillaria tabescens TaxID=1929756 RepID=A0AA39T3E7_ARMTA|nr:uncharacterized protein EV420DRAFT_1477413 [Desarmillaria tabescens]KAK0461666.1 hypothetical protein EV420DRAFT_1477413 [Desarmillaria tabescens]